jgi:hypothetical protein
MRDLDDLFAALARSKFRAKFHLGEKERAYLRQRGLDEVLGQAAKIVRERLAPAVIPNDGKQTPWRNHPVFVAQHATATCCRGCLEKWHQIPKGRALTDEEVGHVLAVLERWLERQGGERVETLWG